MDIHYEIIISFINCNQFMINGQDYHFWLIIKNSFFYLLNYLVTKMLLWTFNIKSEFHHFNCKYNSWLMTKIINWLIIKNLLFVIYYIIWWPRLYHFWLLIENLFVIYNIIWWQKISFLTRNYEIIVYLPFNLMTRLSFLTHT